MARMIGTMLVAGLMLAGCGGGEKAAQEGRKVASGGGAEVDPCSLISAEEMTAITTDKVSGTVRNGASCTYRSAPDDGVQVTVRASGGAEAMDVVHRTAKLLGGMGNAVADKGGASADVQNMLQEDKSAAPALGDEAVWGMNSMLSVRKGDAFVEVTPPIMHDPANHSGYPLIGREEKRKIAEAVAARLLAKLAAQ